MPLGIKVTTGETAGSAGTSTATGNAFFIGEAEWGPYTPLLVKSMAAFKESYGERSTINGKLYDAVETFFQLEGAQCYVVRLQEAAKSTVKAQPTGYELSNTAAKKVISVEARYAGTYINEWTLEVVKKAAESANIILKNAAGEVIEETGYLASPEKLPWGSLTEFNTSWLTFKQLAGYAAEPTVQLETYAAKKMKSSQAGTNPTIAEADAEAGPALFPKTLGPGQLCYPGTSGEPSKEKIHKAMGESALKTNRVALCDIADSATAATLITNKKTYANNIAGYMAFFSSSAIIPDITLGTTRTVAASAVAAGLCAQAAKSGNDSAAPAGVQWSGTGQGLSPFVTGFTNTFSNENMVTLAENGINPFAERQGKPVLYDFVSALPRSTDKIFCQFSASRERMHLVWAGEEIAEGYLFKTIDGRGQLLAAFQGSLMAMLKTQWEAKAIFGITAPEAGIVNVGEPVNTLTTESEGQLNAEIRVRLSPYVESMSLVVISAPITESI
jgi:hypothetical protein